MTAIKAQSFWSSIAGKAEYGATGVRDVLLIVSEDDLSHPDVVPRRPAIELTQQLREKTENQGIARDQQADDLTIMKARYSLQKGRTVVGVEKSGPSGVLGGKKVTRESVLKHITTLMDNSAGGKDYNIGGIIQYKIISFQLSYTTLVPARGTQETGVLRMASSPSKT